MPLMNCQLTAVLILKTICMFLTIYKTDHGLTINEQS